LSESLELWEALLLGLIEGLTEFLPVSSTGHLTVTEKLLGYEIDSPDVTAFTAIIQMGAILATLVYFRADVTRLTVAFVRGVARPAERTGPDWRFAAALALGSVPIGVVGLVFQDTIETTLRNLWFVGGALVLWSGVMLFADRTATLARGESEVRRRDTLVIGIVQCLALIPGVSRSGATLSAGLLMGLDRVTATRLAFFLAIPALTAATVFQIATEYENVSGGVGWPATLVALATSFVVGYAAVAWLLRFVAGHTLTVFIVYRVLAGTLILILVASGAVAAT
jgi:undecaprenyl-diphosphatase